MVKHRFFNTAALVSFLVSVAITATGTFAQAGDQPASNPGKNSSLVLLDSMGRADRFAREKLAELKHAGVKRVELYHVGDETPPALELLATLLTRNGIAVSYRQVTASELEAINEEQSRKLLPAEGRLAQLIKYDGLPDEPARTPPPGFAAELKARLQRFFGVPGGISFLTYVQKRTLHEKAVEAGVALAKVAVTSAVLVHSLHAQQALGQNVNVVLPVIVAAAFNLGFDYWQRGNSAFKGQGTNFDFQTGIPVMNRKFYLLTAFIHSLVVRELIMATAHLTAQGFDMGWAAATAAFMTSFKGLLGKSPIEMFIERGRRTHSKWWTIGWMTAWGTFYASLQILDMFDTGHIFKNTLTVLGSAGLALELYRSRVPILRSLGRYARMLTGRYRTDACETLLVGKSASAGDGANP